MQILTHQYYLIFFTQKIDESKDLNSKILPYLFKKRKLNFTL